ncbi:MAG: hypothetical protein NC541_11075 [bacterium]|nr:hypothetical protein [bacterium]MCM1542643.1 hypothetical protein [Blautia sp.]
MKGYHKIDTFLGYTLWESDLYGDKVPFVIFDSEGEEVGTTYDSLPEYINRHFPF